MGGHTPQLTVMSTQYCEYADLSQEARYLHLRMKSPVLSNTGNKPVKRGRGQYLVGSLPISDLQPKRSEMMLMGGSAGGQKPIALVCCVGRASREEKAAKLVKRVGSCALRRG